MGQSETPVSNQSQKNKIISQKPLANLWFTVSTQITNPCLLPLEMHTIPILVKPLLWLIQSPLCFGDYSGTRKCPARQESALQTDTKEATRETWATLRVLGWFGDPEGTHTWEQLRRNSQRSTLDLTLLVLLALQTCSSILLAVYPWLFASSSTSRCFNLFPF